MIAWGIILIILGLSGQFVLRGTSSPLALVAFGAVLVVVGVVRSSMHAQQGREASEERFQLMTPTEYLIHGDPTGQDRLPPSVTQLWQCESCGRSMPHDVYVCQVCDAYRPGLSQSMRSSIESARWRQRLEESPKADAAHTQFLIYRHSDGAAWEFGKAVAESGIEVDPPAFLTPEELKDYKGGFTAAGDPEAKRPIREVPPQPEVRAWTCEECGAGMAAGEPYCRTDGCQSISPDTDAHNEWVMEWEPRLRDNWRKKLDRGPESLQRAHSEAVLSPRDPPAAWRALGKAVAESGFDIERPTWMGKQQLSWYEEGFASASGPTAADL